MKRTTIFADDRLLREIKELSTEENRSASEIVREALENYIRQKRKTKKLSIIGIAASGKRNIAENHEEILSKKFAEWKR